jgi:hypothetical protein
MMFGKVSDDVFKKVIEVSVNLSKSGFGTVESAAFNLGRALENPVQGMQRLRAVGVVLSVQQKELIKNMVEMGQIEEAQMLLLKSINVISAKATPRESANTELSRIKESIFGWRLRNQLQHSQKE